MQAHLRIPRSKQRLQGLVQDYYEMGEILGKGNYAEVYHGVCKDTGDEFALKRINKVRNGIDTIDKEIDVMLSVSHPRIIELLEVFDSAREVVLVMELCEGSEMFERIIEKNSAKNKYTETEAAIIFRRVLSAVQRLHSCGIIHRDIKPENILMMSEDDDVDVKLADFGLSKLLLGEDYTHTVLGTNGYCAPEVLNHKPYTYSVDIWSLGVLLYIINVGFPPFPLGKNDPQGIKTKQGKYSFHAKHWDAKTDELKDLISQMLVVDPKGRVSLEGIATHPWLQLHPADECGSELDGCSELGRGATVAVLEGNETIVVGGGYGYGGNRTAASNLSAVLWARVYKRSALSGQDRRLLGSLLRSVCKVSRAGVESQITSDCEGDHEGAG